MRHPQPPGPIQRLVLASERPSLEAPLEGQVVISSGRPVKHTCPNAEPGCFSNQQRSGVARVSRRKARQAPSLGVSVAKRGLLEGHRHRCIRKSIAAYLNSRQERRSELDLKMRRIRGTKRWMTTPTSSRRGIQARASLPRLPTRSHRSRTQSNQTRHNAASPRPSGNRLPSSPGASPALHGPRSTQGAKQPISLRVLGKASESM